MVNGTRRTFNRNPEDYKDHSHWCDFFDLHARYFSNAVIQQMIKELREEMTERIIQSETEKQNEM